MIWNKEAECMRAGEREKLQLERLKGVLRRAYKNVPYYQKV
jgi:phenylacetate-CoA ligase